MANLRNVPDGDSIELYFAMPSTRIAVATTFSVEAKYLGTNVVVPANLLYFANEEEDFTPLQNNKITTKVGIKHFYVCARLNTNTTLENVNGIEVKLTPLNNNNWFKDTSYTSRGILFNRFIDSSLILPVTFSTEEGQWGEITAVINPPSNKSINFNCKITHITTNSTALDGIQISVDNGTTWTNPLNNLNFVVPANSANFKIKYFIKTNNTEEGNRYFDITTTETTVVKVLKPLINNFKTRVTVIDTTKLNYGDLISTYCNGRDLYGIYSDGAGGRYEEPIIVNAATCGSVILPPDTVIQTFCAGTTRVQHLSDGAGGYYRRVVAYDSPQCNYVSRELNPDTTVTPTILSPIQKGATVLLNPDQDVFGALLRDNCLSIFNTRFGKWYFEVEVYLPLTTILEVGLGFAYSGVNLSEWMGANRQSWSWWPYDSTKYHSDVQGIYAQTIDVVDKDIIGVHLDMDNRRFGFSINGAFQGWCYEDLDDQKMFFCIAGRFDSWAWVNFGKYKFKYPVPQGFYSGFGVIANPPLEKDTIISYFCVGVDRYVTKADGRGGSYDSLFKLNATECGWVDPKPPTGTVIGYVCEGTDKFNKIADGNGGFTLQLAEINSLLCGWTPPGQGNLSNVLIDNAASELATGVILSGDRLSFTNLDASVQGLKGVRANHGNLSGVWYWELNDWTGDPYIGFSNFASNGPWNSSGAIGVSVNPLTGMVNNRGIIETMFDPVVEGTPIGFKIDFKAQTITCYIGSQVKVIRNTLNYPLNSAPYQDRYYPVVSSKTGVVSGTFNFGQLSFHYSDGNGNNPYQKPSNPYPQRGTVINYRCEGWTRYVSRNDGAGGNFTELFEVNSATCGWYPDPPIGTILGYYCKPKYERWKTVANGNYTKIEVLIESNSVDCGYLPAGTIISIYCVEKDQWATKSDGNDGSYEELIKANSPNCGYIESDNDFSNQEPDPKYNVLHDEELPVNGYDIVHRAAISRVGYPPNLGTFLGYYCDNAYNKFTVVADGNGGTMNVLPEQNSRYC